MCSALLEKREEDGKEKEEGREREKFAWWSKYLLKTVAGGGELAAGFTEGGMLWRPLALSEPHAAGGSPGKVERAAFDRCLAPALPARAIKSSALLGSLL